MKYIVTVTFVTDDGFPMTFSQTGVVEGESKEEVEQRVKAYVSLHTTRRPRINHTLTQTVDEWMAINPFPF